MNDNKKVCTSPLATRPVLYTDTIQGGKQAMRDDLWAVTTDELNALELAKPVAAAAQPSDDLPPLPDARNFVHGYGASDMQNYARAAIAAHLASQPQAAQPSELTESETTGLAKLADRIEEADEQPMVIARSAARAIDKLLAAHLAGQSQVTRAVPLTEQQVADMIGASNLVSNHGYLTILNGDPIDARIGLLTRFANHVLAAAPAAPAQEVTQQAAPVGYARQSELDKLADNRVAGVGMMIHKDAGEGKVALYLAPTTSTVSAPTEIRNQALKAAAKRCKEVGFDWGQAGETRKHDAAVYLANCILDMRTGSAAQAATDKSKIEGVKQPLFDKDPTNIQY